jgi:acyl-CoA synthetase (AMP-forming)/AMP-acid ligase II
MDVLASYAAQQPERPALIEGERTLTWRTFVEDRNRAAQALLRLGLRPGEHAAMYALNSLEVVLVSAAIRAVGAIAVPINHRLADEEVAWILDDADAAMVFIGDEFMPAFERVRAGRRTVRDIVLLGEARRPWGAPLAELLATAAPLPVPPELASAPGGSMIYTAGTTGKPKGARRRALDPRAMLPRLHALDLADRAHVHLVAGPMYHSAPAAFAIYTHALGGTVVVLPRFDAEAALAAIAMHRCTSTFMAPTLLKRLVDVPARIARRHDCSSMRVMVTAGAPCPMAVKEAVVERFGPVLYEFYGSTELSLNTILRPEDVLRKPGSCGRAAPGVTLAILDDAGQPVPPGQPGELHVRRYSGVFDGYWKNDAATRQMQRGDWVSVGDVARMDAEGFVYICDRKRDMIISGGVNIYPAEIEDALHRHPAVEDAAVFGVPDEEWGERVHAAVQLRPGAAASERELIDFCRARLADYKAPREVSFHQDFPRDTAGKLVKRLLREPFWAGRGTRV